jgi:histidyl-tRNA synthetase
MCALLREVAEIMNLPENEQPTVEKVQALRDKVGEISTLAVGKGYEH